MYKGQVQLPQMNKVSKFFIILGLVPAGAMAMDIPHDSTRNKQDTVFIKRYSDKLIVKLDIDNDINQYLLTGDGFKYDIRPNVGPAKTLSASYQWAYLAIAYLPRITNPNDYEKRRGETNGLGIGTGITTPHLLSDINYKKVSGFYLYNTEDYIDNWDPKTDDYIQFPDLQVWMIRGTTKYKLNPNYSIRAIQYQTEAQRKSAASFVPELNYNYYVIDNSSETAASSQKSNNLQVLAQLNYYGTWVLHKRWYLAGGLGIGAGGSYTWLTTRMQNGETIHSSLSSFVMRGVVHTGIGYNAERFISGAELFYHKSYSQQQNGVVDMQFTRIAFQVFVGYRFKTPKFLVRDVDFVNKIF